MRGSRNGRRGLTIHLVRTIVCGALVAGWPGAPRALALSISDVSPDFPFGATFDNMDGRIPGIVIDPTNDSILYATTEWAGVWKSTNGGHAWSQASAELRNGLVAESAYPNLAIDAENPQRLLFASQDKDGRANNLCQKGCAFGGLWISRNGASSWQHVDLCSTLLQPDGISSVVFSSGQPFVATNCGIWTTEDAQLSNGTWRQLPLPRGVSPAGTILAAASNGGRQTIFGCLGGGNKVYRSLDLGQTWDAGVDLGGRCTGLDVAPLPMEFQPSTSVSIHFTSDGKAFEVSVVDHDFATRQDLGFAGAPQPGGSGRSGVWVAPLDGAPGAGPKAGSDFDVFVAENLAFYHYLGNNQWSGRFNIHDDTWWLAFPRSYNPTASSCPLFAANDGGVYLNQPSACDFSQFVDASSGLHVQWGNKMTGVYFPNLDLNQELCLLENGGRPCPQLYLPTTDDDTFIDQSIPNCLVSVFGICLIPGPPNRYWTTLKDGLGDAGVVLVDQAQPGLALACRNGNYHMFVGVNGSLPIDSTPYYDITPNDSWPGIGDPTIEGIKVIQTMPNESPSPLGDYLAIVSPWENDDNKCVENHNCGNDQIVRNQSAADQSKAQSSWADTSPSTHFGPGQIAGIYPSGGHGNLTIYVLTSNNGGVSYSGYPWGPGQVWKGQSINGNAVTSWLPAMGTGLIRAYNLQINPYDPSELYAVDLGPPDPAQRSIKVSHDGGTTWNPVSVLKDISTNYGEFDFDSGNFSFGVNYFDKEIFGNQCPLTDMVFLRDDPEIRFAALYPGGVAFSRDEGKHWMALDATDASASHQPIELPQSAFYDPSINLFGNSSLFVALQGKGLERIDAPYATLEGGQLVFCPSCVHLVGEIHQIQALVSGADGAVSLGLGADGMWRGSVLFDVAHTDDVAYVFLVDGVPTRRYHHEITRTERNSGLAVLSSQ